MKYRIYLDNCCFNRSYDDQSQPRVRIETQAKLFIQKMVFECKVELVWSYVLKIVEIPLKQRKILLLGGKC